MHIFRIEPNNNIYEITCRSIERQVFLLLIAYSHQFNMESSIVSDARVTSDNNLV